jgi:hypothetical protein
VSAGSLNALLVFVAHYKGTHLLDLAFEIIQSSVLDGKSRLISATLLDEDEIMLLIKGINSVLYNTKHRAQIFKIVIDICNKSCQSDYFADQFFKIVDQELLQKVFELDPEIIRNFVIFMTKIMVYPKRRELFKPILCRKMLDSFIQNIRGETAKLWLELFTNLVKDGIS